MRRHLFKSTAVIFLSAFLFALPNALHAQEIELKEGMTQGDFAFWLIKAIQPQLQALPAGQHTGVTASVNFLVNPAAGPEEAITFFSALALAPLEKGWQKDEPLTNEVLASLLEKPEEGQGLSFDELVEKVLNRVRERFQEINKKQAVFRVLSSTPSQPAV